MPTKGFRQLSRQLTAMGKANGGKALRSAAMAAMLPVAREAKQRAPVGNPPYTYDYGSVDPYPRKTYKGRLVSPGFTARSVARRSRMSIDKRTVTVSLGVKPEAFAAIQFIEFGTSRIKKRPWLEPSLRENLSTVDVTLRQRLRRNIDKAIGR